MKDEESACPAGLSACMKRRNTGSSGHRFMVAEEEHLEEKVCTNVVHRASCCKKR
jgi:hypothetical protein